MNQFNPVIRPATLADVLDFYGVDPPHTVMAWAVEYRGKLACIAGVAIMPGVGAQAFSKVKPDVEAPKATILKTARKLLELIAATGLPFTAQSETKQSGKFLRYLGFENCAPDRDGMELFRWKQ